MCLYVKTPEIFVAKRPIYTLKLAVHDKYSSDKFYSYFQNERQVLNKLMFSPFSLEHEMDYVQNISNVKIYKGLHSIINPSNSNIRDLCFFNDLDAFLLAEIPKNSIYLLGLNGDIVSNQLILREVLFSNSDEKIHRLDKTVNISTVDRALNFCLEICKYYDIKIGEI